MKPLLELLRRKPDTAPHAPAPAERLNGGGLAGHGAGAQDGGRAAGVAGTGGTTSASNTPISFVPQNTLTNVSGVRNLPRPALRWVGAAGRIALREFAFETDADAICAFQEETYTLNFPDFRYNHSFAAAFRHDLRRAALDTQHALFVLDEGEIVGFLWLVICQNTWTGERYGYVNNLFIKATRRGQSLGHEMMTQSDNFFRSRRIKRVRLTVTAANLAAAHLYEQSGYTTTRWEMEKEL